MRYLFENKEIQESDLIKYKPIKWENDCIILRPATAEEQILLLKTELKKTDYISNKLSEAQAIFAISGEKTQLEQIYNEYRDLILKRQEWRNQINKLEKS